MTYGEGSKNPEKQAAYEESLNDDQKEAARKARSAIGTAMDMWKYPVEEVSAGYDCPGYTIYSYVGAENGCKQLLHEAENEAVSPRIRQSQKHAEKTQVLNEKLNQEIYEFYQCGSSHPFKGIAQRHRPELNEKKITEIISPNELQVILAMRAIEAHQKS